MPKKSRRPAIVLQPIVPMGPLARWGGGVHLVGPLPTAPGGFRYALVVVEYFSKWVEAKAITAITIANVVKFFWKYIVCHFGVPRK